MEAILIGTAQDAGVPQTGCYCPRCTRARGNAYFRHYTAALGLVDRVTQSYWLIDATPDFREQLHLMHEAAPDCTLRGIFLTHGHIGHYTGLIHIGKEAMNTHDLPIYATASLCTFLRNNGPWSLLVSNGNINLCELQPEQAILLGDVKITPIPVPHRGEFTDTMAYALRGSNLSLFYCPDIDRWEQWRYDVREVVSHNDISLLDGSFFSGNELPGRDMSKIPHPQVTDTVNRLKGVQTQVYFIHFNHSNPLLDANSPERHWLQSQGFAVGEQGQRWKL
ncbi:MAG: MBL fold metallo-hydrolase [Chloroflexota bacterium]|jgi:pyrroloquinoline quinone biosynthesis protein B